MRPLRDQDGRPSDLVQSVSRAMRVLEVVGASATPLSAKAIARRCELHLSTTYHLLRTLCYEDYLVRDDAGDYRLGLEVARRYRDLRASFSPSARVHDVLSELVRSTGHSAYLGTFIEGRVAMVEVLEGHRSPHVEDLIAGYDEAAHATSIGRALLGTLSVDERRDYLKRQGCPAFTCETVTDPEVLAAELATLPPVVIEDGRFRAEMSCAAILVPRGSEPGQPAAAIGLSGPRGCFVPGGRLVRALAGASRQLSSGWVG